MISAGGMEAYLRNLEDPTAEVVTLVHEKWESSDNLLATIENAVYDNSRLLDDYSVDIAIVTERTLWVPASVIEEWDDMGDGYFNSVYDTDAEDIMKDYAGDKVCLYTLARGLKSFLGRTFPGARIRNQQTILVERFGERSADLPRIYIDIRRDAADFVAFDSDSNLLMAVTHEWRTLEDIQYHLYNLMDVYGLDKRHVHISLSGPRDEKRDLTAQLRKEVAYVMMTMVPGIASRSEMSLPAALLMRK